MKGTPWDRFDPLSRQIDFLSPKSSLSGQKVKTREERRSITDQEGGGG